MLECLNHTGHMYALDIDPIESVKTKERLFNKGYGEDVLTIKQCNFKDIDYVSREVGLFDFVLADLGVSSWLDNPERGFSYKEGPLDLKIKSSKRYSRITKITGIIKRPIRTTFIKGDSDEPYAKEIIKILTLS